VQHGFVGDDAPMACGLSRVNVQLDAAPIAAVLRNSPDGSERTPFALGRKLRSLVR
jgi:hypothetical protein